MNASRNYIARCYAPADDATGSEAPADIDTTPVPMATLLDDTATRAIIGAAVDLSNADRQFLSATTEVARAVARVMGTEPSFALWTEVQSVFVARYIEARECTEETARGRWVKVCAIMREEFALEKPAKPSKAAEVKAAQRSKAAEEAAALIESAKATTPAEVLALTAPAEGGAPVAKAIVDALAAEATRMAKDAAKDANAAAREEVKALREQIRKALPDLTLEQLRAIAQFLAGEASEDEVDGAEAPGEVAGSTRASEEVRAG